MGSVSRVWVPTLCTPPNSGSTSNQELPVMLGIILPHLATSPQLWSGHCQPAPSFVLYPQSSLYVLRFLWCWEWKPSSSKLDFTMQPCTLPKCVSKENSGNPTHRNATSLLREGVAWLQGHSTVLGKTTAWQSLPLPTQKASKCPYMHVSHCL